MRRHLIALVTIALVAAACSSGGDDEATASTTTTSTVADASTTSTTPSTTSSTTTTTTAAPVELPVFDDEPCGNVTPDPFGGSYADLFARWQAQVDAAPFESGRPVFVGSSSIRLWSGLQSEFSDWAPIQRGFGGAVIWEVAWATEHLVAAHDPSALVIFAGTNDFALGAAVGPTFDGYRCIIEKVRRDVGDIPIAMIAITPAPSRADHWPVVEEWHALVEELTAEYSGLSFVDAREAFLPGGEPDPSLFIADQLHLNEDGYAIWNEIVRESLAEVIPTFEPVAPPVEQAVFRIDFGVDPEGLDASPWNLVPSAEGGRLTPGEQWFLMDANGGVTTQARLVVAEWNMTTTPSGEGVWVRPQAPGGFTIENLVPGTSVLVTPVLEAGAAGDQSSWEADVDAYGRAHIAFGSVGAEPTELDALEIEVG
ncbi:MAG: GDSL-type esterase/lipase family protein [Actinomycetota bacterium]